MSIARRRFQILRGPRLEQKRKVLIGKNLSNSANSKKSRTDGRGGSCLSSQEKMHGLRTRSPARMPRVYLCER